MWEDFVIKSDVVGNLASMRMTFLVVAVAKAIEVR